MIDESKKYLIKVMKRDFYDKTFEKYINEKLAGDFAYEIALVISMAKEECIICGAYSEGSQLCDSCGECSQ